MVRDDPGGGSAPERRARSVRVAYWAVVALSVAWTVLNRGRFDALLRDRETMGPLVGVLSALAVVWIASLAYVCVVAAARTAGSVRRDPLAWFRSFNDLGASSTSVLTELATSRSFSAGWWIGWIATTLASLLPAVVAVVRLGSSGLGIVGLATVSIGVNLAWRLPVELRMRRLRADAGGLGPVALLGET